MKFIRISNTKIVNTDHILSASHYRNWRNTPCILLEYNCPKVSGGFLVFNTELQAELIYEGDTGYQYFSSLIDTTKNFSIE